MSIFSSIVDNLRSSANFPGVKPNFSPAGFQDTYSEYLQGSLISLLDETRAGAGEIGKYYVSDRFLRWSSLNAADFAKNFGYEFIIWRSEDDGSTRVIDRLPMPISPTSISMNIPAATNLSVTMKGIIEESNGAPLRPIRISGTTAMLPALGEIRTSKNASTGNSASDLLQYAFSNTIRAATNTAAAVNRTVAAFSGSPQKNGPLNYPIWKSAAEIQSAGLVTGYDFFQRLARFLDFYLAAKKSDRKLRLSFNMYKDQMYWDVVLQGYNCNKGPGTLEYLYDINLTAYRRRKTPDFAPRRESRMLGATQVDSLNAIASAINGLREARVALSSFYRIIAGVRSDIENVLITPVNELSIFVSNAANLPKQSYEYARTIGVQRTLQSFRDSYSNLWAQGSDPRDSSVNMAFAQADSVLDKEAALSVTDEGEKAGQGQLDGVAYQSSVMSTISDSDAASNLLNEQSLVTLLSNVAVEDLDLNDNDQRAIDQEDVRVNALTIQDFQAKRDRLVEFAESISSSFGGGGISFNRISGLPAPRQTYRTIGTEEIEILDRLNDMVMSFNRTIAYLQNLAPTPTDDYLSFFADQARAVGVNFQDGQSVYYVPFPVGASLQQVALIYLGQADRWTEIAAVNALKAPYIDEEGFVIPFISSGAGNTAVFTTGDNLYIGGKVLLSSNTIRAEKRAVTRIDVLSSTETLVTFDGDPDLGKFTIADKPQLRAYLPGTVNSQRLIAIPSQAPVSVPGKIKTAPTEEDINGLSQIAKTDLLLSSDGDLVVGSYGDAMLSSGLTNLIQASVIKLQTKRASIVNDPSFGNGVDAGTSVAEIDVKKYLEQINQDFSADARFEGVQAAKVTLDGPAMVVEILVRVANTDVYLPIATRVPI